MNSLVKDTNLAGLAGLHLPKDIVARIPDADSPQWVQRPAGHWYLPLMFDLAGGVTVNVLRYPRPGIVGRHIHDGPVYSYTIEGSWYYPEHDWVAEAGTFVWEPTGDIHTLTVKESMMALYVMHGGLTIVDENDQPKAYDNCLTLLAYCDQWYRDHGMGEDYIKQFIR
jgi:2,4'-dihydroxyacetophenone dioxygenase